MVHKKTMPNSVAKDSAKDAGAQDKVRLSPVLGLRPGVYLTCIYSLAIIIILFFLLVFPGIIRRGSLVTISSEPYGAAVRVDDVFFDAAPCAIFVEEGRRRFDIVMPGFEDFSTEADVGAGIFASLFFPRCLSIHAELKESAPLAALTIGAKEAAAWSFTGESAGTYQTPLSLSEGAYRSAPLDESVADEILRAAARFTSTRGFLKDLLRAKFFVDNAGRSPSPIKALQSIAKIIAFMSGNPDFTVAAAALLEENAEALLESEWYKKNIIGAVFPLQTARQIQLQSRREARFGGNLFAGGVQFVEVEDGIFDAAEAFNHETPVRRYYIAANEISDSEWESFLSENPEWRVENTAQLMEKDFVDQLYLVKSDDGAYPAPTVSGVSWFAAEAYCRWLSTKLQGQFSGWTVRLPTEIEWEYAAKSAVKGLDGGRITKMVLKQNGDDTESFGLGLWEWCADPFVPLYFVKADAASIALVDSPKRSVRGGSWVNQSGTVTPETRGGLTPSSCSPFVSFRPVIAQTPELP
ncbi:MAG: SUMF1/EgtB/PvdO family nonheme iron enzyme [Spirochaetaceae bacterium]|nr:SUMF1/EgtB/PvdO family nonheme iron enzyme [Spirochaetaceae bacterium]